MQSMAKVENLCLLIKACLCSAVCALNHAQYVVSHNKELLRFHVMGKLANCVHSTTSNSHSGANLQFENVSAN